MRKKKNNEIIIILYARKLFGNIKISLSQSYSNANADYICDLKFQTYFIIF